MNTINAPMKADFDIDVGPDGATVSAEGSLGTAVKNNRGYGVSFEVGVQANAGVSTTTENGMTTYTANADASVTVSGGVQTPHVGANGGMTWGVRGEYTVAMPESEATPAAIAGANFYDPTSMPPGTTITVRGEDYTGSELNLTFKKIAVQSSVETSEGTGFIVQRLEDGTVQVMTGPIEGLENVSRLGVDFGVAGASLGSSLSVDQARYQVANFDISTPDGLAAYNEFITGGEMPTVNGDGVSNAHTLSTVSTDWQSDVAGKLGPLDGSMTLNSGQGEYVTVTYPDGSIEATATYTHHNGMSTTWQQSFGPGGTEILSERRYEISFTVPDGHDGESLTVPLEFAINGRTSEIFQPGQEVTLVFTEAEMSELMRMASQRSEQQIDYGEVPFTDLVLESAPGQYVGNHADSRRATPWEFANNLVSSGSQWDVATALANISSHAENTTGILGERNDVPMTVVVDGEVVVAGLDAQIESGEALAAEAGGHQAQAPIPAGNGLWIV